MGVLDVTFTGGKRYRVASIPDGWFRRKQVLILQYEVNGFVPEYSGGVVDGEFRNYWVDAKPEWELNGKPV